MINQTRNNRALFGLRSFGISGTSFFICLALLLGPGIAAGQTPQATPTPAATPTPTPTPEQITLSANGYKVKGRHTVDLSSTGATSSSIDVYRNGVLVATVPNSGFYTHQIGARGRGSYTYKVCEAGTQNCSNQVTVRFGGGG
jgi:serine protease